MELLEFIKDTSRRASLAAACGASPDYLWQVATGWEGRKASPKLARKIHEATHGLIPLHTLRPDIWPAPAATDAAA